MDWTGLDWIGLDWTGLDSTQLNFTLLYGTVLCCAVLCCAVLRCAAQCCAALRWNSCILLSFSKLYRASLGRVIINAFQDMSSLMLALCCTMPCCAMQQFMHHQFMHYLESVATGTRHGPKPWRKLQLELSNTQTGDTKDPPRSRPEAPMRAQTRPRVFKKLAKGVFQDMS